MATLDEESAEECIYALPRGGKPIRGPSIRFAEILKQSYGNCRAAARVVHVDKAEGYIEAEGVFHDLESNSASTARVRRRITDKTGRIFKDDMIMVTGNAACSIAMRNAILAGVPKPLWRKAYEMVQATITGDITTLSENREKAFKALAAFGVKPEQVFQSLGIEGEEDITVDHIATLRGMYSALKNGEATVEEMFFGTLKATSDHQKIADPLSDKPIEQQQAQQEPPVDNTLHHAGAEGGGDAPSTATLETHSQIEQLTDQDKISLKELIIRLKSAVGDDPAIITATAHSFNAAGFKLSEFASNKARTITKHFMSACTGELEASDAVALACGIAQIDDAEVR